MKHLKTYEKLNNKKIKVGDYIIMSDFMINRIKRFEPYRNIIGKITNIDDKGNGNLKILYHTRFDITEKYFIVPLYRDEIKYWSDKKEDLEHIINANKFNL